MIVFYFKLFFRIYENNAKYPFGASGLIQIIIWILFVLLIKDVYEIQASVSIPFNLIVTVLTLCNTCVIYTKKMKDIW